MGVVMQVRSIILWISSLALLAGCGVFDHRQVDYKTDAVAVQPLEVPPDLVAPAVSGRAATVAADGTQVANFSDFTRPASEAVAPVAAPVIAPVRAAVAAVQTPSPKLLKVGTTSFILLSEPFDRAWRSVGLALDRAGIKPTDRDRSKGLYYIKVGGKDQKYAEVRLHLADNGADSTLTVEGKAPAESVERLLASIQQRLAQ